MPGVERASFASTVRVRRRPDERRRAVVARRRPRSTRSFDVIGADYFETLGLRVLRGRELHRRRGAATTAASSGAIDRRAARARSCSATPIRSAVRFSCRSARADPPQPYTVDRRRRRQLRHDLFESPPQAAHLRRLRRALQHDDDVARADRRRASPIRRRSPPCGASCSRVDPQLADSLGADDDAAARRQHLVVERARRGDAVQRLRRRSRCCWRRSASTG